jgi:hypothetical protein
MERQEALSRLKQLEGIDLRPLADNLGVTVWRGDRINKARALSWTTNELRTIAKFRLLGIKTHTSKKEPQGRTSSKRDNGYYDD